MLDQATVDTFSSRLGDTFRVLLEGLDPIELELVEARSLEGDSTTRRPFSLLFRGPREPVLAQMIRTLDHESLGPLDLFLVPVGPDRATGGLLYEAVFG